MLSQRNSRFYKKVKKSYESDTLAVSDLEAQRNLISCDEIKKILVYSSHAER